MPYSIKSESHGFLHHPGHGFMELPDKSHTTQRSHSKGSPHCTGLRTDVGPGGPSNGDNYCITPLYVLRAMPTGASPLNEAQTLY